MKHKDTWTNVLYIILFVAVFVLLQFLSRYLSAGCIAIVRGIPFRTAMNEDSSGTAVAVTTVISSLLTFAPFTRAGWAPVSRTYLRSRPWGVLFWAFLLAAGCHVEVGGRKSQPVPVPVTAYDGALYRIGIAQQAVG